VARIGKLLAVKIDDLTGGTRAKLNTTWQAARGSWGETSLDSRVSTRLRWEKSLSGSDIQITVEKSGAVRLQGKVADTAQRTRAVALAESTLGVDKVVDELVVKDEEKKP
jgi:osmotically-inducible protein OsmY